ncbi:MULTISPECIES: PTS sugar transporter subunit IIA [Breznakia]|uniref:Ascorbate-specific PTS system EIIA component n=1 Tax=Breznakia blatticola TaxID=1754012 RepID=A0A4R7ZSF8_9FIRM|nr:MULTISPECIES: PTS sugar transporter subunit IIA [Breznakia]MDH6368142.1 PTS system ascorbate-specific IIA component [Breznakia sp. PH1-1]MDH6405231.1 PTS system ascorbate-specific IIA component [Breznakia sp. PF1-11]MDH6412945.1 PTS system ascorbate-specific IIA component [Breznakia sp. PFB1-11]MDH6415307.1 PTS system ascorbate-specific IIA component [Breznakia sp. PFB1-14]MDH6417616.1 PTS system ascorbate-specific IIA component [Breznakia sp. PFB1-4]
MKMLDYLYENDLVRFEKGVGDWREAIRIGCQNMIDKKFITETYVDEIIECVDTHGAYIVLLPGVAMPHSTDKSTGVLGTGIGFTKFDSDIEFEKDNPEKSATLFFTLAAKDANEHSNNISRLSSMLMEEGVVEDLLAMETMDDFLAVREKYKNIIEED